MHPPSAWVAFRDRRADNCTPRRDSGSLHMPKRSLKMVALAVVICANAFAQHTPPPRQCPVLATLASSKVHNPTGDNVVIWFWNQGTKAAHGIEFRLVMLDAAGNRYPASQQYVATGSTKPNSGDVVAYPAKNEEDYFGQRWKDIEGIEVYVVSVMFSDATTWKPSRGVACKTAFINGNYAEEIARMEKRAQQKSEAWRKKWNREHPNDQIPADDPLEPKKQ